MGTRYQIFDEQLKKTTNPNNQKLSVYQVFRCGMAHEYFVRKRGVISMLKGHVYRYITNGIEAITINQKIPNIIGQSEQGVGILDDGRYFFIVEQYYIDFSIACRAVHEKILKSSHPHIPKV